VGASSTERENKPFRADIQGLRAVAVLAVVFYHAHVVALSGGFCGVDVFFVISGFLITDLLWRELADQGRISLKGFYARRARRLLPAAMLVLAVTMLASLAWLSPLQVGSVWKDGVATALYGGNYRFAFLQTNYLTSSLPPSPFQQYWSLGVEEQFYLLWPLLLLLSTGFVWRRGRRRPLHSSWPRAEPSKRAAITALAIVAVASFAFSVWLTTADQPWAFFSLPSRAWELAAGGLIALGAPALRRLPRAAAAFVGWAGLAGVVASVLCFGPFTPFPGWAALGPVAGAAGVVAGGLAAGPWGPVALLGRLVMRGLGDLSYSWYLWHWPVLVLAPAVVGHALSETAMVELAIGSGVLAWATYELVEQPARRWSWLAQRPSRALLSGLGLSSAGVATCLVAFALIPSLSGHGIAPVATLGGGRPIAQVLAPKKAKMTPAQRELARAKARLAADQHKLALVVGRSAATTDVPANLQPPLPEAAGDEPLPYQYGCLLSFPAVTAPPCAFGDVTSGKTVVIFGDSHALQWFPALDKLADARHWRLVVWTKATCPPVEIPLFSPDLGRAYTECSQFLSQTMARIEALHPMLVVLGMAPNYDSPYGVVQDGPQWLADLAKTVSELRSAGAQVLVMGPVESPSTVVPDCLSGHLDDVSYCDVPPTGHREGPGLVGYDNAGQVAEQQAVVHAGGHYVDVKPWFCAAKTCPVIVGNLLVFRDNNHITATYSAFLYPVVADEVDLYFPPAAAASHGGSTK
jgi:peptidoglycan/LPS O-acetylase OafA/YrhL